MTRSFELEDGTVVTIAEDGRVRRSAVPVGFDPQTFRNILAAIDVLYRQEGVMPTIDEVFKLWPKITRKTYSKAWTTSELKQALAHRGIDMEPSLGLSEEQSMAILVLANPDGRALSTKLKSLGISQAKYHAWMRQKLFSSTLRERAEQNLGDAVPVALNNLIANADKGDQRAIEKLLEVTGRYNPAQIEVANARQVVLVMVESVLRRVTDPEIRSAILEDVQDSMVTLSITSGLKKE